MTISVVIPAYNEEKYIGNCLRHIQKQTEKPDEIIVVNNNSTDRTAKIAKMFNANVLLEAEQGIIPARNAGFNAANSDIIVRTDADTQVPSDWIQRIKEDFENNDIQALTGPVTFHDMPVKSTYISNIFTYGLKFVFGQYLLFGPNFAITKKLWEQIKDEVCFDASQVHEDFDISLHTPNPKKNIMFDPKLVIPISARRIKSHPESFFGEYLIRTIRMWKSHR